MREYKAVLFDLDGTLIHTTKEFRFFVVNRTLWDIGRSPVSQEYADRFWFVSGRDSTIRELFSADPALFWSAYRRYDTADARRASIFPYHDVLFLSKLKAEGYRLGVVTGAPLEIMRMEIELLSHILGADAFQAVVSAHPTSGSEAKPHPDGIEKCLGNLGVAKNEAIYVGNAREDVDTARNAGVLDVLVLRGEYEFEGLDASVKISDLYGLKRVLGL
jgi:phosphoglycolate phosphatase-like HAD superfamily hydrolase